MSGKRSRVSVVLEVLFSIVIVSVIYAAGVFIKPETSGETVSIPQIQKRDIFFGVGAALQIMGHHDAPAYASTGSSSQCKGLIKSRRGVQLVNPNSSANVFNPVASRSSRSFISTLLMVSGGARSAALLNGAMPAG